MKNTTKCAVLLILTISTVIMSGCGHSGISESELKAILPDTITSYYLDEDYINQDVGDINIIKADINDNMEFIECEITLKDDNLERGMHVQMELTKYEVGGWQIDYWAPLSEETIISAKAPSTEKSDAYMSEFGYANISSGNANTDNLSSGYYEMTYNIDDHHEYVSFKGIATYTAELIHQDASNEDSAQYIWNENTDFTGIDIVWNVEGFWEGTEINPPYGKPDSYDIQINSVDSDGTVDAIGKYYYPEHDGLEYTGRKGSYDYTGASAEFNGASPSDASLTISIGYSPQWINMKFTADDLEVSRDSLVSHQEYDFKRTTA